MFIMGSGAPAVSGRRMAIYHRFLTIVSIIVLSVIFVMASFCQVKADDNVSGKAFYTIVAADDTEADDTASDDDEAAASDDSSSSNYHPWRFVEDITGESLREGIGYYGIGTVLSIIGVLIPVCGIAILLFRPFSKNAHLLLVADVICVFYNITYLMFMGTYNVSVELIFLKFNLLCSMLFYLFYLFFMVRYLNDRSHDLKLNQRKIQRWTLCIYGAIAAISALILVNNRFSALFYRNVQLVENTASGGSFSYLKYDNGILYYINYVYLAVVLIALLVNTVWAAVKSRSKLERINHLIMCVAQIVIIGGLSYWMINSHEYDYMPFTASISILVILTAVIKGNFLGMVEFARGIVYEQIEDVFITVDNAYHYLDSNKCAKKIFPELENLPVGAELPPKILAMFTACPIPKSGFADFGNDVSPELLERWEVDGRYYRSIITDFMDQRLYNDSQMPEVLTENIEKIKKKNYRLYNRMKERIEERNSGHCLMLIDTTEQLDLLHRVNEEKNKALAAAQSKSDFLSNMSHEIRTPMNAIVGMTQIMLRGDTTNEQKEYLTNIRSSGDALLSIINDILDFSKLESGKMEMIDEEYEPMSLFNDLSMIFLNRIGDHPVELIYDVDPVLPKKLLGDKLRIRQVITNIANNAIKFTDEGYIKLSATVVDKRETSPLDGAGYSAGDEIMLHFEVEDTGQGIKEEDLDKLFGSFSQVDTKKNRAKEGTGLGLAISKSLVNAMGGDITVTSTYGKGSVFAFDIIQKVVDGTPAANVNGEHCGAIVAGAFSTQAQRDNFDKLCREFSIKTVSAQDVIDSAQRADVIFCDLPGSECMKNIGDRKDAPVVIVLRDPMKEKEPSVGISVNKPLYSLNFCQLINKEETTYMEAKSETIDFCAPDARILIVDDNEINLKVAAGLLAPLEMTVDTASNGREALEKITEGAYNIIFMDHMMPELDGVETTRMLRERDSEYMKTVPVIALSANAVSGAREEFIAAGMDDFVSKPIEMVEISRKIKAFLPRDLIHKKNVALTEDKGASEENIAEEFAGLTGIDVNKGIKNSGGVDMYRGFLADYIKLIDLKKRKVEECLNDGLIRDLTIEVHALKSTSYLIGAVELGDAFYELEQLGNAEDVAALERRTPEVLEEYLSMKEVLSPFAVSESDDDKKEPQEGEIKALLDSLKDAADAFDLDEMDDIISRLKKLRLPDPLKEKMPELEALVADCAADDIIALVDGIGGI